MADVVIRREGAAGRITLNRPDALNALTHDMVLAMTAALDGWADDDAISCVIVDAAGKAFCAGGDLRALYQLDPAHPAPARRFWADEYRLNARIAGYPKPYVAIMDGVVMGGGVGVSAHGSHRIVSERTVLAMPEVTIGFMPDVGGTWLLARAPDPIGLYLGLTGARIGAADAVFTGFADHFVPAASLPLFVESVIEQGADATVKRFAAPAGEPPLRSNRDEIEGTFSQSSAVGCLEALDRLDTEWSRQTEAMIRRNSPLSVACAFEAVRRARAAGGVEECLTLEYRFAYRCLAETDFREGIRAAIIERDRAPAWRPARLEEVDPGRVAMLLSPLGEDELRL